MKKESGGVYEHYSYSAYADPAMAASFDAKRFGGPIGHMLLEDQERVLMRSLGDVAGLRILDVATGTGRAALALAGRGARVTGVDASTQMLDVARSRAADAGLSVEFAEVDAQDLVFPDRAFDAVVCLRLLMHVPDWKTVIAELCRVSRGRLVVDFPALASTASFQAAWRRVAQARGSRVEAYRVFSHRSIRRELARHGFRITSTDRQFVLPIALHKSLGSVRFTRGVEAVLANVGLLRLTGSPVTVAAERCES